MATLSTSTGHYVRPFLKVRRVFPTGPVIDLDDLRAYGANWSDDGMPKAYRARTVKESSGSVDLRRVAALCVLVDGRRSSAEKARARAVVNKGVTD